jgi:hypothetical protein
MSSLVQSPNLRDPDGFYAALVTAHQGLSDEASELLNARLVLILANHVGDPEALSEALALARTALARTALAGQSAPTSNTPEVR